MALEDSTKEAAVRQNPDGYAPTTFAIKEGAVDCLEVLFHHGVDMEKPLDSKHLSPVQASVRYTSAKCFIKLSEWGMSMQGIDVAVIANGNLFNVHLKLEREDIPSLHLKEFDPESLAKLLKHEGFTQVAAKSGTTLVHEAIKQDDVFRLEELLQAGLSPNTEDAEGLLPLYALKSNSNLKLLELLLENGAWQPGSIARGTTLVHQAVKKNDVNFLEEVLLAGLTPNTRDSYGLLPLYTLKSDSNLKMLELLMNKGSPT